MTLEERIARLEKLYPSLYNKIYDLSENTEQKPRVPYTKFGGRNTRATHHPYDVRSQWGGFGGTIYWNDTEIYHRFGTEPSTPTEGYHKHTHGRFSGGALIKGAVEVVEFESGITNFHSQQFLNEDSLIIAEELNSQGQPVKKIGLLDLIFNPDGGYDEDGNPKGTWGIATYAIDVEKCFFVKTRRIANKDIDGNPISGQDVGDIELDENGNEMKSPLYVTNDKGEQVLADSSVKWDKNGRNGQGCFRLFATYVPEE